MVKNIIVKRLVKPSSDLMVSTGALYEHVIDTNIEVYCKYLNGRIRSVIGDGVHTYAELAGLKKERVCEEQDILDLIDAHIIDAYELRLLPDTTTANEGDILQLDNNKKPAWGGVALTSTGSW